MSTEILKCGGHGTGKCGGAGCEGHPGFKLPIYLSGMCLARKPIECGRETVGGRESKCGGHSSGKCGGHAGGFCGNC